VEVRACTAPSRSTSRVGNRFSTSSSTTRLEARERCAEAEVDAVAEGEVLVDPPPDVEAVAIRRGVFPSASAAGTRLSA
jgi:hypothetical protein